MLEALSLKNNNWKIRTKRTKRKMFFSQKKKILVSVYGLILEELKSRLNQRSCKNNKNKTKSNKRDKLKTAINRGGGRKQRRQTIENQSIIIFLNEEGNGAPLILLIRLSISPQEAKPKSDLKQTQRSNQGRAPRYSLLSSLSTWILFV